MSFSGLNQQILLDWQNQMIQYQLLQQHYHRINQIQLFTQQQGWQQQQINPRWFPAQITTTNPPPVLLDLQTNMANQNNHQGTPYLDQCINNKVDPRFEKQSSNDYHISENQQLTNNRYQQSQKNTIAKNEYSTSQKNNTETQKVTIEKKEFSLKGEAVNENNKQASLQNLKNSLIKVEDKAIGTEKNIPSTWIFGIDLPEEQEEYEEKSISNLKISTDESDSSYSVSPQPKKKMKNENQLQVKQNKTSTKIHNQIKKISKNIPKNIFKGIIKFIIGQKEDIRKYFENDQDEVQRYINHIKRSRNTVLSMQQIKSFLHSTENEDHTKLSRILSYQFVDKHYIAYIYNSKIKCRKEHLANRVKFLSIICSKPYNLQLRMDPNI